MLLVDWGIAKVLNTLGQANAIEEIRTERSGSDAHATRMGSIAGTPAYMAPEQAMGKTREVDAVSDIYSLGATLYTMLAGQAPVPVVAKERPSA